MKEEITVKAKSLEEALAEAAARLGVEADKIDYTVVSEARRGFLGIGATDCEICASYTPEGEKNAVAFIRTVLEDMRIEAGIETSYNEDGDFVINVNGEGSGVLIGHHGDTLDSLQYLVNLAANRRDGGEKREFIRVNLDIEGYRAKREEALRQLARRQAEKVLKYKRSVMLEPMTPYERRIIHSEIQKIEGVSTNSIGSENNRKIVIYIDQTGKQE